MSTMTRPDPAHAAKPRSAAIPSHAVQPQEVPRFVTVHADLLPGEVVTGRRAKLVSRKVVIGLLALAILLAGWFGVAKWQTTRADNNLYQAQRASELLQGKVQSYAPLVTAQARSAAIANSLSRLMAGDVQWAPLIDDVFRSARGHAQIASVAASMAMGGKAATAPQRGGLAVLNQTGKHQVGSLTISGSAPDKNSLAAFVDALGSVKGLAAPFPASVGGPRGQLTFSVEVILTSDALGGRFTAGATAGGH